MNSPFAYGSNVLSFCPQLSLLMTEPAFGNGSPAVSSILRLRGLTKTYREGESDRAVLDDLEATIDEGEFVVLMGRSGSGKSTLLNLVSGIDLPTSGSVEIGETDLTTLSETELPLELSGIRSGQAEEQALSILERVGLGDRGDSFPDRLSGGEQQRVAVARALAADPLLILADEPTGNLDYETGRQVLTILTDLVTDLGKTLLVATHDRMLLDRCDRVVTLHGGTLHDGAPDFLESSSA